MKMKSSTPVNYKQNWGFQVDKGVHVKNNFQREKFCSLVEVTKCLIFRFA